ncbi:MAG: S8 family serine peptidase [bacterium]|nr:S8 family serine peptidase [bacterium]
MRSLIFTCFFTLFLVVLIGGCSGSSSPVSPDNSTDQHNASITAALNNVEIQNTDIQSLKLDGNELLPWGFRDAILADGGIYPIEIGLTAPDREISLSIDNAVLLSDGEPVDNYHGPADANLSIRDFSERIIVRLEISGEPVRKREIIVRTAPCEDRPAPGMSGYHSFTDPETGVSYDIADNELLVGIQAGTELAVVEALVSALDCEILREIPKINVFRVRIPGTHEYGKFIELFESSSIVKYAEVNGIRYVDIIPDDTYEDQEYENGLLHLYEAWDITEGTLDTLICVIDSGAMRDHPDLAANIIDGEDFINPIGDGLGGETPGDGQDNDNDGYPDGNVGHGTHCAGILGAVGNNDEGVSGHSWNTKIMPLRVFPTDGDSGAMEDAIAEALVYAADYGGVDGISMSFGAFGGSQAEQDAINYAWNKGCVLVAAAGNNDSSSPFYPAAYANVLSVAATDSNDKKADFSNYGSTIDVCAPGVDIISSIFYEYSGSPDSVPENQRYAVYNGTSMACPQVSGLVALIATQFPAYTNTQIVDQIKFTADNIDSQNPSYIGKLGSGRINDYRAVTTAQEPDFQIISISSDDDQPLYSQGNRDGFVNPGEIIEFRPTFKNSGLASAQDCYVSLEDQTGNIQILNDNLFLNIMSPGETYSHPDPFIIRANPNITQNTDVELNFIFEFTGGDPIEVPYSFTVRADLGTVDIVDAYGQGLLENYLPKGVSDVPALSFTLEGDTNYATLEELTVSQTGTAGPDSLGNVQLWLDQDGNGSFSTLFDTRVAYRSYNDPRWRGQFDDLNDPNTGFNSGVDYTTFDPVFFDSSGKAHFYQIVVPTAPGIPRTIFVVIQVLSTANSEETVQIGILEGSDVIVKTPDQVNPIDFPIQTDEVPIRGTWQDPQQLTMTGGSGESNYSWRAETATCPVTGNVYVVFDTNRTGNFDVMVMRSTNKAQSFEDPVLIDGSPQNDYYPDVQVDSEGVVHVVYYSNKINNNNREIFYCRSTDFGVTWGEPVRLTNATRDSRIPKLAIGLDDSINVAWHDDRTADNDYNIYFIRSDDGGDTWSTDLMVNDSNPPSTEVAIAVGYDGVIHIVWEEVTGQWWNSVSNVFYARSTNNGLNFSTQAKLNTGSYDSRCAHADITADDLGNVYAVFHYTPQNQDSEICAISSNNSGMSWNPIVNITSNNVPDSRPCIHVTPDGDFVDIAFRSLQAETWNIWHTYSEDGLASWEDPVQISASIWGDSREPVVTRDLSDNIYAFWEDLIDDNDNYEVFYNRFLF